MEKLEKKHHDHSFTECLKNIIFGLVMLAPMLAIAVRCGYVMWNKNAKDSYSGVNENAFTEVVPNTFENGQKYTLNIMTESLISSEVSIDLYGNIEILQGSSVSNMNNINENCVNFRLINNNINNMYISFRDSQNNSILNINLRTTRVILDFTSYSYLGPVEDILSFLTYKEFNDYYTLDNTFSYSVSQLSNDPIFNWTRNTGIYTPINAMVSGLEIENDTLQILLAYWSLMTAVYIVFDLIIFCFTKITHFING